MNRDTVANWLTRWELGSLSGLEDQPRCDNPGILTPSEKQLVIELCQETSCLQDKSLIVIKLNLLLPSLI